LTREVGYVPANSSAYADSLKLIQMSK
jgi:hypothetical protein